VTRVDPVLEPIVRKVAVLKNRHEARIRHNSEIAALRKGNWGAISGAEAFFSDVADRPVVANQIDTLARHAVAALSPLPLVSCQAISSTSDAERQRADKRTKIANHYLSRSAMRAQMQRGADFFYSYGLIVAKVDFLEDGPMPIIEDSSTVFPVWDRLGRTIAAARVFRKHLHELIAEYPDLEPVIRAEIIQARGPNFDGTVEVTKYEDAKRIVMYVSDPACVMLVDIPNPVGRCTYVATQRPGLDDEIAGAFDQLVFVQLAKNLLQLNLLDAVDQAVNAPWAVPDDVLQVAIGPNEVIRSNSPDKIGRVKSDVPQAAWAGAEYLKEEINSGAISPEALNGSIDASVVTGKGVQQLMAGYSQQIAMAQETLVGWFEQVIEVCFCVDEKLYGTKTKKIKGKAEGSAYRLTYTPEKDIDGDYSVDVTYGGMAGLDPNRALVYLLQGQGAGLFSKDYVRRHLPGGSDLNPLEEEIKIQIEALRGALLESLSQYALMAPQIQAQGGDPGALARPVVKALEMLQKGEPLDKVYSVLYPEPKPEPQTPAMPSEPGAPGNPAGGDLLPEGIDPAMASRGPGGRPDLAMLFAGNTASGAPNLQAGVSRMIPT
jgi:hypothetical protein